MKSIHKSIEIYDAKISFMSLVDRPANRRSFLMTKATDKPDLFQFSGNGKILNVESCEQALVSKAESEVVHFVTGIAYEPMVADTDDNFMTAGEIEKMAHWFLKNGCMVDEQHDFEQNFNCHIVESWIASEDTTIGGQAVQKGTWLVKVEVKDAAIWQKIENGDITGFSVGGLAKFGTDDIDIEQVAQKGERKVEIETPVTAPAETDEKRSLLAQLAKMFGFSKESEVISKGNVADRFSEGLKADGFWLAFRVLEDELFHWDTRNDRYVFEGDAQAVANALADFNRIVTTLLTGSADEIFSAIQSDAMSVAKSALPIKKAEKNLSPARLDRLKAVQKEVNSLVEELSDGTDTEHEEATTDEPAAENGGTNDTAEGVESPSMNEEESKMTHEEIAAIAANAAVAAVKAMKDEEAANAAAVAKNAQPTAPEATPGLTAAQVEEMIQKALAKDTAEAAPDVPGYITREAAQQMVDKAVSELRKARGAATSLNEEGAMAVQKDTEADFWANTFVPGN